MDAQVEDAARDEGERTTCYYRGFKYTRAWASNQKVVYRCSRYRSTACKATMHFTIATMGYSAVRPHTCRQDSVNTPIVNVIAPMNAMVDGMALSNLSLPASVIWQAVRTRFYPDDGEGIVQGLNEQQVLSRVYRVRRRSYGGDVHGMIEQPPLSLVSGSDLPFFQFHFITPNADPTRPPNRIIGWAHPTLVNLLRYHSVSLFIDGTFRCVPRKFAQCIVIMVHDRASGLFVPVFYILTTARTGDTYWDLLHLVVQATDQQLAPADVICDFEAGLIGAITSQFPDSNVIGCLFHLKQAVQRRMKKLRIPAPEISIAMTKGVFDMLTVINPDQIVSHGLHWVRKTIKTKCEGAGIAYSKAKWKSFWVYFTRTWVDTFEPALWNVFGLDNHLVARTNNPLERFNRELNTAFQSPHPSLPVFVAKINEMSASYVQRLADVPRGRTRRVVRETIPLPRSINFVVDASESSDSDIEGSGDTDMASVDAGSSGEEESGNEDGADLSFDYEEGSVSSESEDFGDDDLIED